MSVPDVERLLRKECASASTAEDRFRRVLQRLQHLFTRLFLRRSRPPLLFLNISLPRLPPPLNPLLRFMLSLQRLELKRLRLRRRNRSFPVRRRKKGR